MEVNCELTQEISVCYAPPVGFLHAQAAVASPLELEAVPKDRDPSRPAILALAKVGILPHQAFLATH